MPIVLLYVYTVYIDTYYTHVRLSPVRDRPIGLHTVRNWAEGKLVKQEGDKAEAIGFCSAIGTPFSIGRGSNCDLVVSGLTGISVSHCSLRVTDQVPENAG